MGEALPGMELAARSAGRRTWCDSSAPRSVRSYASRAAVVVIGLDAASRVTGVAENQQRWTPRSLTVREMVDLSAVLGAARDGARATRAELAA